MDIYILHAGISHPSPYFHNLGIELKKYPDINLIINPELPNSKPNNNGVIYFNRLKRFYRSDDKKTADLFLKKIDNLKNLGWKIVWSIHGFFPNDREITEIDDYLVKNFIDKCDLLFTLSDYLKDSIKKNYGKESIKHSMGINKLDGYFDRDIIELDEIPNDAILFSFVGNIYTYKLLDVIIDKFNKLKNNKKIYLLIAGPKVHNQDVMLNIDNPNIILKEGFIGDTSWNNIAKRTDCFICLYDLNIPAYKYGFYPSNIVKLQSLKKVCITANNPMITELADSNALLTYEFPNNEDFMKKVDYVIEHLDEIKEREAKICPKDYSWESTAKIIVEGLRKLYE